MHLPVILFGALISLVSPAHAALTCFDFFDPSALQQDVDLENPVQMEGGYWYGPTFKKLKLQIRVSPRAVFHIESLNYNWDSAWIRATPHVLRGGSNRADTKTVIAYPVVIHENDEFVQIEVRMEFHHGDQGWKLASVVSDHVKIIP